VSATRGNPAVVPAAIVTVAAIALGAAWLMSSGATGNHATQPIARTHGSAAPTTNTIAPASVRPFAGQLLIADRGNNRLLVLDPASNVTWQYPSATAAAPPGGFYFPDDAFFVDHGRSIITNEEENHTIARVAYPSGALLWSYGHPHTPGSAPGYLNQPDDAFLLRDGRVTVADAKNCRILFIGADGQPVSQIGTTRRCVHDPPRGIGYPNGDTPLANGDVLVSEINGSWVSEYTQDGKLAWTVHLPVAYPSDPQQLGPNLYMIADYARPGGIVEFTREGTIVWQYRVASGPGMLDHPSLADQLPNGLIGVNDDYRHRVALIDPATKAIVWQYGQTDHPGATPGLLNTPDGFDLLLPDSTTPLHTPTG
jgi:outer membrane protein assembly factor BamB